MLLAKRQKENLQNHGWTGTVHACCLLVFVVDPGTPCACSHSTAGQGVHVATSTAGQGVHAQGDQIQNW